jgi:hypothetical protein
MGPNTRNKRIKNRKNRKTNKRGGVGSAEKKLLRAERLAESKKKIEDSLVNFNKSQDQSRTNINSMFKKIQLMDSDTEHDITDITPPKADCPIEVYPDYETLAKEMKEIVTADKLKTYLERGKWISGSHGPHWAQFEADMNKFMQMKEGEKVVWELVPDKELPIRRRADGTIRDDLPRFEYNTSKEACNILLTNKGKILYIMNNSMTRAYAATYKMENHDFWIPSECIDTIKILFKNIRLYTINWEGGQNVGKIENFVAIYNNLNEWLEHVKSTIIQKD